MLKKRSMLAPLPPLIIRALIQSSTAGTRSKNGKKEDQCHS